MDRNSYKVAVLALAAGTPLRDPGAAVVTEPASGATITIFQMERLDDWVARIDFTLVSSHDSGANGVVPQATFDTGANWDNVNAYTYSAATGLWTYSIPRVGCGFRIRYTNSATTLTAWRGEVRLWADRALAA